MDEKYFYEIYEKIGVRVEPLDDNYSPDEFAKKIKYSQDELYTNLDIIYSDSTFDLQSLKKQKAKQK
jgi:hypothetical protein